MGGSLARRIFKDVKSIFSLIIKKILLILYNYINNNDISLFAECSYKLSISNRNIIIKNGTVSTSSLKIGDFSYIGYNCFLSADYYVKASKDCGKFEVEHPNSAKKYAFPEIEKRNELNLEVASIDIEEGDLLLFPSYLPHKVSQNNSDQDRIVISFNVDIPK